MKTYNLVLLTERRSLGKIEKDDLLSKFKINLLPDQEGRFKAVFGDVLDRVSKEGEISTRRRGLTAEGVTSDFWTVFVQTLFRHLNIIVSEKIQ